MLFNPSIVLNGLDDGIEDVFADSHIGLEKHYQLLAIVGEYPHAVLKTQKAARAHHLAQVVAIASAILWNIEHDKTPALIPVLRTFRREERFRLFQCKSASSGFRNLDPILAVLFDKANVAFYRKPCGGSSCLKRQFVLFPTHDTWEGKKYIRREHADSDCSRDGGSSENSSLYILLLSSFSRTFFEFFHIPIIRL